MIGHVEQVGLPRLLLRLVACPLVVGVVHVLQPLRRLFVEVQLALRHGARQFRILLGIVAAHLERVHQAVPVPRPVVVVLGGHAHQVRSHEQKRGRQAYLDGDGSHDPGLGLLGILHDADAVDGRTGAEHVDERQHAGHGEEPDHVEVEGMAGVDLHADERNGIRHVVADDLDAQVVDEPGRVEIEVLALGRIRGHLHVGNARRVLGGVEIRVVRIVSELDLQREQLRGLGGIEVDAHVVYLGAQIRELQHVIDGSELIGAVGRALQFQLAAQVDGVVAGRPEEVHVEQERFQQGRSRQDGKRRQGDPPDGLAARPYVVGIQVCYVLANGRHDGNAL